METILDGTTITYWFEDGGEARLKRCSCGWEDPDMDTETMTLHPFESGEDAVCPQCGAVCHAHPYVAAWFERNGKPIGEV